MVVVVVVVITIMMMMMMMMAIKTMVMVVWRGWSGGAKVLCILHHWGVQLILAYSWARPAILVVGKGRGGMFYFFCFFTFIPVPLSSLSLSFISSTLSSISFLPLSGRRHKMTLKGWRVVKPQHNQSINGGVMISIGSRNLIYGLPIKNSESCFVRFDRYAPFFKSKKEPLYFYHDFRKKYLRDDFFLIWFWWQAYTLCGR